MKQNQDEAQVLQLSWRQRLRAKLFPAQPLPALADEPGWAPGEYMTTTIVRFTLLDRLRLLLSPWVQVEVRSQTDRPVRKARSRASVWVLPPFFKPPPPQVPALEEALADPTWAGRFMTETELLDDLLRWADRHPKERDWLLRLGDRGELSEAHHGFGRWVRNWYGLWREGNPLTVGDGYTPQVVNGADVNPRHPDNYSMSLIEQLYAGLKARRGS